MPTFMDYHDDLKLPAEAIASIAEGARNAAQMLLIALERCGRLDRTFGSNRRRDPVPGGAGAPSRSFLSSNRRSS